MLSDNLDTIVTVTGGSGFLATHIVQQLLQRGYTVRATVRKIGSASSKHLTEKHLCPGGCPGKLQLFEGDLGKQGSFDAAVDGAKYVLHTASPFLMNHGKQDPQTHLIDPALKGTENVLQACTKTNTVERVVLTSSVVSIHTYANDRGVGHVFTEEDWNERANIKDSAYPLSKTLAEKKAWEMAKAADWDLVTINPGLILGPTLSGRGNDGTFAVAKNLIDGSFYIGMNLALGCVDVRDVALAHVLGFETPSAKGRYICVNKTLSIKEMGAAVRTKHKRFWTPRFYMPKWMAMVVAPLVGLEKDYVKNNVGFPLKYRNAKIKTDLHLEFRNMDKTITDTVDSMIEHKMIK